MWHKVPTDNNDILFKKNKLYLIVVETQFNKEVSIVAHYYDGFDWVNCYGHKLPPYIRVTHWMDIPELPHA